MVDAPFDFKTIPVKNGNAVTRQFQPTASQFCYKFRPIATACLAVKVFTRH